MSASAEPHLIVERDGPVMVLTMNNPGRRNALTPQMISLMAQAWDDIDNDDSIRVAIITGAGPKAREIAARVAANGPLAIRNAKASILRSGWLDDEEARKIEQRFAVEVMRSADAREGLAAFAEKREPRFTGT